jgi:uncharacterized protein YjgD (DUF1641 family)
MSADTAFEDGELADAIAENPEAVAAFVRRLDSVNELLDVLALGENAMTDEMARELAGTTATLAESADGIATDETIQLAETVGENGEQLEDALESLLALQRSGTLEELVELAEVVSLLTAALDDEMVRSLSATGSGLGELAQTAAEDDTRDGLETLLESVSAADDDAGDGIETLLEGVGEAERAPPEQPGLLGLLRKARDPDVQLGLGYILAIAEAIGRSRSGEYAR